MQRTSRSRPSGLNKRKFRTYRPSGTVGVPIKKEKLCAVCDNKQYFDYTDVERNFVCPIRELLHCGLSRGMLAAEADGGVTSVCHESVDQINCFEKLLSSSVYTDGV